MKLSLSMMLLAVIALSCPRGGFAAPQEAAMKKPANYRVTKKVIEGHATYHLADAQRKMEFGLVPDIGNFGYEFKVNGKDVFITPDSFKTYMEKRWFGWGNPFMAPFANRIDHDYYYFQGKKYLLNDALGNLRRVPPSNYVLHGVLVYEPRWEVTKTGASDAPSASAASAVPTSRPSSCASTSRRFSSSLLMSMRQPVNLAARRTFCPFLPIARESCLSSTITSTFRPAI